MATEKLSTMTDPRARRTWRIRDAVIRFRKHAAARVHDLPVPPRACTIGAAGDLRLEDPSGKTSREHAQLVPLDIDGALIWKIHDLRSKNGLRCDGEPLRSFLLRPGVEIGLGSLRLIAESDQLIGLLSVLRRFLGWVPERQEHVDQAMRILRDWAAQRVELIVLGDGDLMPVARRLHNLVLGEDVPFTWHVPTDASDDAATVEAAAAGTLCVKMTGWRSVQGIVGQVLKTEDDARPQLILCTADEDSASTIKGMLDRPRLIHVPPLASRFGELEQIVQGYAQEIAREQRLQPLEELDLERLLALRFKSLAGVETGIADAVQRVLMIRTYGPTQAAAKLELDHHSLIEWAERRKLLR
jgi:FHA domain